MPTKIPAPTEAIPDLKKDQAFMVDTKALKWIVKQSCLKKDDTILEIGAGTGNLTRELARSGAKIIAVESDPLLEKDLRRNLKKFRNVKIVIGNGLKVLDSRGTRFNKVISNIPYAISEALMQRLVFHDFEFAVLTLPKKFAHRLISDDWEKDYSMLSFLFQKFFIVESCLDLQKDSFSPSPRTSSVVLKFISKPRDSLFCQLLIRPGMVTRNALREALCSSKGYTKNQARSTIKNLNLKNILDKKVSELDAEDMMIIVRNLAGFNERSRKDR